MPEGDQVTPLGDQGNQDAENQSLGWRSALPDDQKEHEFVKTFTKPGDFVKSALEIKADRDALKGKFDGAIFKPDDQATLEQREAYYRAIGKPEKATEYEFPKTEGVEHDPKMIEWAQSTFHAANLTKDQAKAVSQAWDGFATAIAKADQEAKTKARTEAETALKAELGDQYPVAAELTKRLLTKHAKPEDLTFLEEGGIGNHPALIRLIFDLAKKTGEDLGVQGSVHKEDPPKVGMNYTSMDSLKGG